MLQRAAIDSLLGRVTALKAGDWSWPSWRTLKWTFVLKVAFSSLSALFAIWLVLMWYSGSGDDYPVSGEKDGGGGEVARVEAVEGGPADAIEMKRASYEVIARDNIFNPKRKEKWEVRKAAPRRSIRASAPIVRNRRDTLVLEGVVVFDGNYTAFVKDTAKPRDGVKQVMVGDVVDDFTVISIKDEELTLKGTDGTTKVLSLYSKEKSTNRRSAATTSPAVGQPRLRGRQRRPIPIQRRTTIRK